MLRGEFHESVKMAEVLPLPKDLVKVWDSEFVKQRDMRLLENEGKGYCGYYTLALVENALLGRRAASPLTIRHRLHSLAELYAGDKQNLKYYKAQPMHWLQDFELSWYLNWLQVNWVLLHYRYGKHKQRHYSAEVQGKPGCDRWVFLVNKGQSHWVVLTKSHGRGDRRTFDVVFTPEETTHMLLSLGVDMPEYDSRVLMEPSNVAADYKRIKQASRQSKKSQPSRHSRSRVSVSDSDSDSESDSDSDATFRDDPYR